jgi:hypothetical protein
MSSSAMPGIISTILRENTRVLPPCVRYLIPAASGR